MFFQKYLVKAVTFSVLTVTLLSSFVSNSVTASSQTQVSSDTSTSSSTSSSTTTNTCPQGQFLAEFFDTINLSSEVVATRCDSKIGLDKRDQQSIKIGETVLDSSWSVRWSGKVNFDKAKYEFKMNSDDGSRLFIDNKKVIDSWKDQDGTIPNFYKTELEGIKEIKMEYYQRTGRKLANLEWKKVGEAENVEQPKSDKEAVGSSDQCRYKWCPMPIPNKDMSDGLSEKLTEAKPEDEIDIYAILRTQADLSEEYNIKDFKEQGDKIYQKLVEATKTQESLIKDLEKAKTDGTNFNFEKYYIVNTIRINAKKADFDKIMGILRKNPEVRYLEEVGEIKFHSYGYSPTQILADQAHATGGTNGTGVRGDGVTIGIIDSGVRASHQDLNSNYRGTIDGTNDFNWYDSNGTTTPRDCGRTDPNNPAFGPVYHGTHVAGIAVGNGPTSDANRKTGVAPGANWIAAAAVGCDGNSGSDNAVLGAMQFMLAPFPVGGNPFTDASPAKRPQIVNNSWGVSFGTDLVMYGALAQWRSSGILPVFSAGNDGEFGEASLGTPGSYDLAFTVGAVDVNRNIAFFSSRGPSTLFPGVIKPDVVAGGVAVNSAWGQNDANYRSIGGTSMAAPQVAGCAALIKQAHPNYGIADIEDVIKFHAQDLGTNGPDMTYGHGLVNCFRTTQGATLPARPIGFKNAIGNRVWVDLDGNGLDNGDEPAASNITVRLRNLTSGNVVTTTTNFNGFYRFNGVIEGNQYRVELDLSPNYSGITTKNVTNPAVGTFYSPILDSDFNTTVCAGTSTYCTDNFTFTLPTAPTGSISPNLYSYENYSIDAGVTPLGRLRGWVWNDLDQGGTGNEAQGNLLDNYTLRLYEVINGNNQFVRETITSGGPFAGFSNYRFDDLSLNKRYRMEIILKNNDVLTLKDAQNNTIDGLDSDFETVSKFTDILTPNGPFVDAGLFQTTSIGDQVWEDLNGNNLQDANENGVNGLKLTLFDMATNQRAVGINNQPIPDQVTQTVGNVQGFYRFTNLRPGTYRVNLELLDTTVRLVTKTGNLADSNNSDFNTDNTTNFVTDPITITTGQNLDYVDAGIVKKSAILGNKVWEDINDNNLQDASEPGINGVVVSLTDKDGNYVKDVNMG